VGPGRDYGKLGAHAADRGIRIGAINSNLFQDDDFRLGSLTHPDEAVRRKAIDHHAECIEVMRQTGSTDLKI
jgi:L-rhamnose isomerase/sugar isomerase